MASAPPFPSPLLPWSPLHSPFALSAAGLTIQRPSSVSRRHLTVFPIRALKEWSEYEEALREKDLARALRYLKSEAATDPIRPPEDSSVVSVAYAPPDYSRPERDWEVLDACLNADDMRLVGSAYAFLQDRGFLPNFGKFGNIVLEGPREVTPTVLTESTGLEASKLAPQKWGLSGSSRLLLVGCFGGFSLLLSKGIDIRPNLAAILVLGMLDAIFLGGSAFAQVQCFWPPYKRRVLVHEAGHLLTAYLMGCPIRGVILDPIIAMQMGIQGQGLNFGMKSWTMSMQRVALVALHLIGIVWYFLLELQQKLLFMERLKVEKTMRTCSGVYVFSFDLH
ncbi:uncharacterized protein LOC141812196 isoform X3 [Curcuma longa]|uniref:uncharacterized protein LOC141812196 isoform X3 n=1 Tax=Curcuma longa TaxID=136217 RepID=UPI003D9E14DA